MSVRSEAAWAAAPALTSWWVRAYTRGLPAALREARRHEIASDVFEQIAAGGLSSGGRRAARAAVVGRTARGALDDLAWRIEQGRIMNQASSTSTQPTGLRAAWAAATQAWFAPAAAVVLLFNVGLAVGILADGDSTMPGRVGGPMFLFAFGAVMGIGLRLRWASRYPGGRESAGVRTSRIRSTGLVYALAIVATLTIAGGAVGSIAALVAGVVTLVALGFGLVASRRSSRRTADVVAPAPAAGGAERVVLADALIIVGTLPAFAFFWIVVPAVVALVVVVGVVGTGPGARRRAVA